MKNILQISWYPHLSFGQQVCLRCHRVRASVFFGWCDSTDPKIGFGERISPPLISAMNGRGRKTTRSGKGMKTITMGQFTTVSIHWEPILQVLSLKLTTLPWKNWWLGEDPFLFVIRRIIMVFAISFREPKSSIFAIVPSWTKILRSLPCKRAFFWSLFMRLC